jgi:hypothetical protein
MKRNILIVVLLIIGFTAKASAPNWSVEENKFEFSMYLISFVNIDGVELSNTNDKVAVFVGDECRGVSNLIYVKDKNSYYLFLTAFANKNGELMKFKVYDSTKDIVVEMDKSLVFSSNERLGGVNLPFVLAQPELNSESSLLAFDFKDVEEEKAVVSDNSVLLKLPSGTEKSSLIPEFEISEGANLFIGETKIKSGEQTVDFSSEVELVVVSEDKMNKSKYHVLFDPQITYYRKNTSCYSSGAVKVICDQIGAEAVLYLNDKEIQSKQFVSEEIVFTGLAKGSYKVSVNEIDKVIVVE